MARYLSLVRYSSEARQGVRAHGYASRLPALQAFARSLGGSIESMDFMMSGEWDFAVVIEMPTTDAMLAMSSFASTAGTVDRVVTYELFSGEQVDAAVAGHAVDYTPPV